MKKRIYILQISKREDLKKINRKKTNTTHIFPILFSLLFLSFFHSRQTPFVLNFQLFFLAFSPFPEPLFCTKNSSPFLSFWMAFIVTSGETPTWSPASGGMGCCKVCPREQKELEQVVAAGESVCCQAGHSREFACFGMGGGPTGCSKWEKENMSVTCCAWLAAWAIFRELLGLVDCVYMQKLTRPAWL